MVNGEFLRHQQWRTTHDPLLAQLSTQEQAWVLYPDSLTAALKRHSRHFAVQPLQEYWSAAIYPREQHLLPPDEQYWVREVLLQGDGVNWVFARSVIPQQLCHDLGILTQMGTRPLGEFLFTNQVRRSPFEWCQTTHGIARHSVFHLGQLSLLVNECFLPQFFQLVQSDPAL